MMMQNDLRDRLEQVQQRLVNAARELDAASVHIRVLLDGMSRSGPRGQTPYTAKPETNGGKNDT